MNNKKAFIDQIMLGFLSIIILFATVATVNDQVTAKTKYTNLLKIVQTATLSAAKHYNQSIVPNSVISQNIALEIVKETTLGSEVYGNIVFTWELNEEPNYVKAKISNYIHPFFWLKFTGVDSTTFDLIESKANILSEVIEDVNDFAPIAVNGCNQTYNVGDDFDFLLKTNDMYDDTDNIGFFSVYKDVPGGGESSFAHFKTIIDNLMKDKEESNFNINDDVVLTSVTSDSIENDVKMLSQAFSTSKFPVEGKTMSIAILDCGSEPNNLNIKKILPIKMNAVYCNEHCCTFSMFGMCIPFICNFMDMMNSMTDDVFDTISWGTSVNTCNSSDLYRINFEVLDNSKQIVLEY